MSKYISIFCLLFALTTVPLLASVQEEAKDEASTDAPKTTLVRTVSSTEEMLTSKGTATYVTYAQLAGNALSVVCGLFSTDLDTNISMVTMTATLPFKSMEYLKLQGAGDSPEFEVRRQALWYAWAHAACDGANIVNNVVTGGMWIFKLPLMAARGWLGYQEVTILHQIKQKKL